MGDKLNLLKYEKEIVSMRRLHPPVTYMNISKHLRETHNISVSASGIFKFVKRRIEQSRNHKFSALKYNAEEIILPGEEPINQQIIKNTSLPPTQDIPTTPPNTSSPTATEKQKNITLADLLPKDFSEYGYKEEYDYNDKFTPEEYQLYLKLKQEKRNKQR